MGLAEWCHDHGLNEQALAETLAVLAVNKTHPQARRLLIHLQPQQVPGIAEPVEPKPPLPEPPPSPRLDLTAEALNQFGTRVQPILMNACAGCHNDIHRRAFRLTRTTEIGIGNRATMHQNISAVLSYVNLSQPQASPFLSKAMTAHWSQWTEKGMIFSPGDPSQPPIQNRNSPAYRTLEEWVRLAVATSPQVAELQAAVKPPAVAVPEPRTVPVTPADPVTPEADLPPRKIEPPPVAKPATTPPSSTVSDPYDPEEFNRRTHPDRRK